MAAGELIAPRFPVAAPQPDLTLIGLRAVSDESLTIAGRRERRFSVGRWDDAYVRSSAVMTVEDAEDRVYAFANLIPDGVAGEATIDLMRRRPDAPALKRSLGLRARHLDCVLTVKGLRDDKDTFKPEWEPRHLVYPSTLALPVVALAVVRLTEGERRTAVVSTAIATR